MFSKINSRLLYEFQLPLHLSPHMLFLQITENFGHEYASLSRQPHAFHAVSRQVLSVYFAYWYSKVSSVLALLYPCSVRIMWWRPFWRFSWNEVRHYMLNLIPGNKCGKAKNENEFLVLWTYSFSFIDFLH